MPIWCYQNIYFIIANADLTLKIINLTGLEEKKDIDKRYHLAYKEINQEQS